jgi:hypothetical protein
LTQWLKIPHIAVIIWNVANKQYSLLQVSVAALLIVSCATIVKRYPHPLDCNKYYLRIDGAFYNHSCPNKLIFDQNIEQCTLNTECKLQLPLLPEPHCNQNKLGYYCESPNSFTYCTHDNKKIMYRAPCPGILSCNWIQTGSACAWCTYST